MALLEGWTALTALARDTKRIRLGTSVLCNSYRHPSVLAKMAATLAVISEGRLELGLGAGWFKREFEAYGIPFPPAGERVSALGEALEAMKTIWTEPTPVYTGRFYTLDGAICYPPPLQKPHPPLWVGGEGDRVQRIAARSAQGINIRWWSPEKVRDRRDYLAEVCAAVGRDPATLRLSVTTLLAPTESAEREAQARREFASIPEAGLIAGSPQKCIERIIPRIWNRHAPVHDPARRQLGLHPHHRSTNPQRVQRLGQNRRNSWWGTFGSPARPPFLRGCHGLTAFRHVSRSRPCASPSGPG
jgi:alkanesulfonate monooxygenase SsuD/methylene tetrahydromethanopterin reductase-like flavin-dependent oxidoreductase (luciferase family)